MKLCIYSIPRLRSLRRPNSNFFLSFCSLAFCIRERFTFGCVFSIILKFILRIWREQNFFHCRFPRLIATIGLFIVVIRWGMIKIFITLCSSLKHLNFLILKDIYAGNLRYNLIIVSRFTYSQCKDQEFSSLFYSNTQIIIKILLCLALWTY